MKRCGGFCLLVVLFLISTVIGETVKVPLLEIDSAYIGGFRSIRTYTIPLNLQATFSQIDQMSLQIAGKITPGASEGEVSDSGLLIPACVNFCFDPDPQTPGRWEIQLTDGRFNTKVMFQNTNTSDTWDFLLDGQGELICEVTPTALFPPIIYIFEAYLEVEGTLIDQTPRDNPFPIPGDANRDGMVDVGDLGILAANFGREDRPLTGASYFDLNADGMIDVGDLGILAANYGGFPLLLFWNVIIFDQGDFNYDGKVDVGDLGMLAANYGFGVEMSADFSADYAKAFGTTVEDDFATESDEDNSSLSCPTMGLPLLAGLLWMMMFYRMECE